MTLKQEAENSKKLNFYSICIVMISCTRAIFLSSFFCTGFMLLETCTLSFIMFIMMSSEYSDRLTSVFWNWSSWTFYSLDITSEFGKFNVIQGFNKGCPGHWCFASSIQPFLEDFYVDLFSITVVFVGYDLDLGSTLVI